MRKFHLKKFSIFFIFVFMIAIIFSFILKISSFAEPRRPIEDIDVDRLIKASDNSGGKVRIDVKPRPNPGAPPGAPGAAADVAARGNAAANRIPGDSIVSDTPVQGNPLVGSTVKVRVKQGFSFGNGNIRNASLVWKTSSGVVSRPINLQVQAGSINNFNGAFYEFRPSDAGMHQIHFEINYKIMGDGTEHTAVSSTESFNFVSGVADPGVIPGGPGGPGGPVSDEVVFVPPPPGQDTPPDTVSKKIKINFKREAGGPDINERQEYVWKWPHELPEQPRSRPAKAHNYAVRAVIRGAELESEDEQGIDGAQHGALDERERNNYIEYGGRYYRKAGIDIDGDGPLPDSLKANWEVRYPSVTPNGSGGWNVAHNLSKKTYEGDNFQYKMPEPSEPFKVIVGMKVKHKWRDFFYDKAPSQIPAAIQYYNALKSNTDPTGAITPGDRYKDISTTFNAPSASGGEGTEGPLEVSVTISGTIKFKEWKKVGREDVPGSQPGSDGRRPQRDVYDWVGPITQGRSQSFKAGTVKHNDEDDKFTDESIVHELVLDTTAPKIEFAPQTIGGLATLTGSGDIICSSGDLINVRVKVIDNNRYSALRTPFLTYETAPSANNAAGSTWSAVPLMMEPCAGVPDNAAPRPFAAGNWGYFQALVPSPHNIKGTKALRWFVDAFDGAKYQQPQPYNGVASFGNFNHGNFEYNGDGPNTQKVDQSMNKMGTLSIYDNDRPNINVKMWKVDRSGIYLVGDFEAAEDYFTEDFYYDMTNPSDMIDSSGPAGEYKAKIPPDTSAGNVPAASSILGPGSAGMQIPATLIFPSSSLFPAARKAPIADNLKYQIEDAGYDFFKYHAGFGSSAPSGLKDGNCPVVFEDVKYIFTVDAYDNIEGIANNGVISMIPKPERTKVSFELKDTESQPALSAVNMEFREGQSRPVTSANEGKMWYLGPEDPSIPLAAGVDMPKEVPTLEHVFHSVSADNAIGNRYLKVTATDRCGHKRNIAIHFKVNEVTNELRVLEEQIKRELKQQRDAR